MIKTSIRLGLVLCALFSSPVLVAQNISNEVSVTVQQVQHPSWILHYSQPVRWQQVLGTLQTKNIDPRWSQLMLTEVNGINSELMALEAEREQVLADLHVLGQRWARQGKNGLLRSTVALSSQLTDLPLVARQLVNMNYDQVRIYAKHNPLLTAHYQLAIHPRPTFIWAQGLVSLPGKRPLVDSAFAYDYGRRLNMLAGANGQQLWVIQPDGQIMTSPIDPFSPEFVGVAPGATLYVGFKKLPREFASLNQRIMTLFANREL